MVMDYRDNTLMRAVALMLVAIILGTQVTPVAAGSPGDDLKTIQNKYYFRGKYDRAIDALQTYLARTDVIDENRRAAREFLAASFVLSGREADGKQVFVEMLSADFSYGGPDKSLFKQEVLGVFTIAREQVASMKIRNAPQVAAAGDNVASPTMLEESGKPIYKKWWFYAGIVAVLVIAGAASDTVEEGTPAGSSDRGTVSVRIQ